MDTNKKYTVGIYLFQDVEVLDFAGPFEVFAVSSELHENQLFDVKTITSDGKAIKAKNGLKVQPDYGFGDHPLIDILVLPGGSGTRQDIKNTATLDWIAKVHSQTTITMSVCTGSLLLGVLGLLDNLQAVTHHTVLHTLEKIAPKAQVVAERFVDNGKIMTAGGISAGIDLSLHVVEKLFGEAAANKTRIEMEYQDWRVLA